jgi:cytochrome c-type biogenesis protein CcmH/NrfF
MIRIKKTRKFAQAAIVGLLALVFMGAGDFPSARYNRLGHAMMCMCGCGQILLECNHVGCSYSARMTGELKQALLRGDNDDTIKQWFVSNYGNTVLAAPTTKGFNRVAWIMPFVIFALALAAVVVVIRTWKLRRAPAAVVNPGAATVEQLDDFRRRAREDTEI